MSLPTPNLRLGISNTFVYSRKIMMEKWVEHFNTEVRKQRSSQAELGLVTVRNNVKLMQEALKPDISESRLQEILQMAKQSAERHRNDGTYKRTVGSLDSAIAGRLEAEGSLNLETLVLPPTKPPGDDVTTGSRGFLTPTHSTPALDMSFFTPPRQMRTLADAVREAAPVEVIPEFVEPDPPVQDALPDEIMEPVSLTPIKKPKTEKEPEKEIPASEPVSSPKKSVIPASPKAISHPSTPAKSPQKTPQKKKEITPVEVKIEEIKEEEDVTPSQSPPATQTPRSRGRPRIHSSASKKTEKPETPRAESPDPLPPPPSKKRPKEPSQEPSTNTSSKRPRTSTVVPMITRRRKEGTPHSRMSSVPPIARSESSFDFQTAPASPMDTSTREIEVQTDITIRQAVQAVSMGERRRSHIPPVTRKVRKSMMPSESIRSVSRNSSTSTPGPRGSSVVPNAMRSQGMQTNIRLDIEKDELLVFRVDSRPNYHPTVVQLDSNKPVVVSFETCKEIAAENANESSVEIGKRAAKVDGKREMTLIVETDDAIGQRLVEDRCFQLVSATSDLPSAGVHESPVKRHRRDDKAREDTTKLKLLAMYRYLHDCEWSEAFKKPVPLGEATYDQGVLERIDLSLIKKEIDNGTINSESGFLLRAYRMLSNAIMYNGYDHDVHLHAKYIIEHVMNDIHTLNLDDKRGVAKRAIQVEEIADASRSTSMDPDPMTPAGNVGMKRTVFRKDPNVEGIMTASGSRKGKKNLK